MAENKTENDFKCQHPDQWLTNEVNFRKYLNRKQLIELGSVVIFCVLIFMLGYSRLIGGETIAALLGAFIGYCFEHWRKKNDVTG